MSIDPRLEAVTERIVRRSAERRAAYLERLERAAGAGPARTHLGCSNQAHAYAAAGRDQARLAAGRAPNLGIVTAYNDMLSAHAPFADYPDLIKRAAAAAGATAQVAGGVPAMCDGITQGTGAMELSLFSRDAIALAASIALSHDCFDAALFLGVCDKIVPGLVMAAASFGHIPAILVPAGPMSSGLGNDEKARIRQRYAAGEIDREALMAAEMAAYHGPGTCTFYGTANSKQMLMEIMGLHLPGASFIPPAGPLRAALTAEAARRAIAMTALAGTALPVGRLLGARAFVNGLVGLMATGGSTNLVLHLPAMARAAGIEITLDDFADISAMTPLIARIYPNGLADVNHFHAAGGMAWLIGELRGAGLLHDGLPNVAGGGLDPYCREPKLTGGGLDWHPGPEASADPAILRPVSDPFQPSGGLVRLEGNLGRGVIKVSAVAPEARRIEAPARIFDDQAAVRAAFRAGELERDLVVVLRFQGPRANGMPELHGLVPLLSVLQGRGHRVALVTDGRMSGASGKVPAAIHLSPEAAMGGPLARLRDGDPVRLDAGAGRLETLAEGFERRRPAAAPAGESQGLGRELFAIFRDNVGTAETGAASILPPLAPMERAGKQTGNRAGDRTGDRTEDDRR